MLSIINAPTMTYYDASTVVHIKKNVSYIIITIIKNNWVDEMIEVYGVWGRMWGLVVDSTRSE